MATLVCFHAHPDDEAIATGGTMTLAAASGHRVVLVTATRGERGEPQPGVLDEGEPLWERRVIETHQAAELMGLDRVEFLGYEDSGMIGEPSNDNPLCFWQADVEEASQRLAKLLIEVDADVLTIYDSHGGYGHPDHIQVHRVTHYALDLAASATFRPELGAPWEVSKVYWPAFPKSIMRASIEALKAQGSDSEFAMMDPDDIPFACDDELVTTVIEGAEYLPRKLEAMRAHGTQIAVDGGLFALADGIGAEAFSSEYYRLALGEIGDSRNSAGLEDDLFAGITA
jgi:N-acetyl-1-D-myo-inositol-2-amino-2-deoxy-alpha-D-glucopyranoside deacetylase